MNTNWTEQTLPISGCSNAAPIFVASPGEDSGSTVRRPEKVGVWGTPFARLNMEETVDLAAQVVRHRRPEYFITANLNYLMLTEQHPRLVEVNEGACAILADGHPIVKRSRWGGSELPCRVAGSDLIVKLAEMAAEEGYRIYFLGGEPDVAKKAADALKRRFPALQIAGCYSPPFRPLTSAEHSDMLERIQSSDTDILLVAFGQPKGEFWIADHLFDLKVPLSIQLGASFDFLAGTAKRAPRIWQSVGCEWLYRALSDPIRLVPRYSRNAFFMLRMILRDVLSNVSRRKSI